MQLISTVFDPLIGKRLLDIGCGSGALIGALQKRQAVPAGIDTSERLVELARAKFPDADLQVASAADLPFADAAFDGAVILNSLHHFPARRIGTALREALRVIRPRGHVLIIEPLARGAYYEVLSPLEDERPVRAAALEALDRFLGKGLAKEVFRHVYDMAVPVESAEALIAEALRTDPSRRERAQAVAARVKTLFAARAGRKGDRTVLDQPMVASLLAKA